MINFKLRDIGGKVLVYGKGGRTRAIKLPFLLRGKLQSMRGDAAIGKLVFTSRKKKGHLKEMQVNRIVKAAAKRVPGLEEAVIESSRLRNTAHDTTLGTKQKQGMMRWWN